MVRIDVGPSGSIGADVVGRGRTSTTTSSGLLELFGRRPGWMRDSLCREHPEVSFFPAVGESIEPAKAVRERCSCSSGS